MWMTSVAEDVDGAGVRLEEAVDELHQNGFAAACWAENDAGFATLDGEGDVLQDGFDVEDDGDIVDDHDGFAVRRGPAGVVAEPDWARSAVMVEVLPLPAEDADHRAA